MRRRTDDLVFVGDDPGLDFDDAAPAVLPGRPPGSSSCSWCATEAPDRRRMPDRINGEAAHA